MKSSNKPRYQRVAYLGIVLITLGIIFMTNYSGESYTLGLVLITVGGIFFIISTGISRQVTATPDMD